MDTPPGHEAPSQVVHQSMHYLPDAKQQRYDRQLRLWAASGQASLESAHILVVNASATATSVLKNLVLPGIGAFTLLDDKRVDEADLGNNFFLEPGSTKVGDWRAVEAAKYLGELNEGVKANALTKSVSTFLEGSGGEGASTSDPLAPYSLVISVDAPPADTLLLSDRCWNSGIPLVAVRSCGFVGTVRTQMEEVHFVETHPDHELTLDLRLDHPFPSLGAHASSVDFAALNSHDYAHIPAIVILLQALEQWKDAHNGQLPQTYKEKTEFRTSIGAMKRGGAGADHENFDEAVGMVMKAVRPTGIPKDLETLFNNSKCESVSAQSPPFWILLRAVRNFVRNPETNEGAELLPLSGSLPDMKATSTGYGTLQTLYRGKSKDDLARVRKELSDVLQHAGLPDDGSVVNDEALAVFVKNVAFVKVVSGRKMRDEYERPEKGAIRAALTEASMPDPFAAPDDEGNTPAASVKPLHFYLALRAADLFHIEHARWPGSLDPNVSEGGDPDGEQDVEEMQTCWEKAAKICLGAGESESEGGPAQTELGQEEKDMVEQALKEITRAGASDMPQMAALLGGVAAQEVIKITTRQYVPLNGTFIFDGLKSTSQTVNF